MKILAVLTPVVTSSLAHAATVAFYEQLFEQPASPSFENNGLHITKISLAVVISAADEALLAIPRQLDAIFSVDDVEAYWELLAAQSAHALTQPAPVPGGRNFFIQHPDGKTVEYLQVTPPWTA